MATVEHADESVEGHLATISQALTEFRDKFAIQFIVSISGGAEEHNLGRVHQIVTSLIDGLRGAHCAILSGGTQGGIPELATKIARQKKLPTIAVYPKNARKYVLTEDIDLPIETLPPSLGKASFGTETPTFAQLPDYAVVIGGSYGTLAEVSTMLKVNTKRKKDEIEPIRIIPISGSDGIADLIPQLVLLEPNLAYCLPAFPIRTGAEAAEHIIHHHNQKGVQNDKTPKASFL